MPLPPLATLMQRHQILRAVRETFYHDGYFEVETPVRIVAPAQEQQIDCIAAAGAWLRPSPELQMKRLMTAGAGRIFQLGPVFRAAERGSRHNPEFTLVEWYATAADSADLQAMCQTLILNSCRALGKGLQISYQGVAIDLTPPWESLSVSAAFQCWAGWNPLDRWDAERFDHDMALLIEPQLPRNRPLFLTDYPAPAASLARLKESDPGVAERFELYIAGLELANAYVELTDGAQQRARFEAAAAERRSAGKTVYPFDEEFLQELESGRFPPCGGVALGLDRLVMLLCDAATIDAVRPFCPPIGALW